MLLEQETELLTTTEYQNYLDSGGRLPEQEYSIASELLGIDLAGQWIPYGRPAVSQIASILHICGLETSSSELLIYKVLRDREFCKDQLTEEIDERCKNVWCMSDQELVREIVLLSDQTGEKYRVMTEKFSHIFEN